MGVLDRDCPTREVIGRIADTWTVLTVLVLAEGPCRFGALRRRVDGVSPRMLTVTLRRLERDGLVVRHVRATSPPSVEYALTALGRSLLAGFDTMRRWSEDHWQDISRAREAFDGRPPAEDGPAAAPSRP